MSQLGNFRYTSHYPCTVKQLYDYHSRPGALERLLPPWDGSEVLWKKGSLAPGGKVMMKLRQGPLAIPWEAHHVEEIAGQMFRDIQHRGPFAHFSHNHVFSASETGATLADEIDFALPGGGLVPRLFNKLVNSRLQQIFRYREHVLRADLELHARCSKTPLRILITGASGVIGKALVPLLTTGGHEVWRLVRRPANKEKNEIFWDPAKEIIDRDGLPELDGVVHLAGEFIGLGRWSAEKKRRVVESRTKGTGLLAKTLAETGKKPQVLVSASAVGYYGDCADSLVSEDMPAGIDFISEVCTAWEKSTEPATQAGIRTVLLRLGVGLTPRGGALERMLAGRHVGFFRRFGAGKQYISWMSMDDMVAAILHCLVSPRLHGPINIAAPNPVTNREFMQTLAAVMNRPLLPPMPAMALDILYGQMASEILLSGCRVSTNKLMDSGFVHRHPKLDQALSILLGKK